ncbi:unnamed protein product [Fusarium graminearum]|uniref:Uncharacterized protein n=1 Tax=Gibberella zeae TaxID=5518 RepID=A0A4E9EI69_GIBZA|nr:unnamed protein product [Fusarium graminearum]CAG1972442.1 unnamed protein product [Fusarium graminearum]
MIKSGSRRRVQGLTVQTTTYPGDDMKTRGLRVGCILPIQRSASHHPKALESVTLPLRDT